MRAFNSLLAFAMIFLLSLATASPAFSQCKGEERWPVKTGTDPDVSKVNTDPLGIGIDDMNTWNMGKPYSWADLKKKEKVRISPYEFQVYHVEGLVTWTKCDNDPKKGDQDYLLVLQSDTGQSIIAKIPNPKCVDPSSPFFTQIKKVRAIVTARLDPTGQKKKAMVRVAVEGPAFFDKAHGQLGRAENSVEIHPVLNIQFLR